MVLYNISKSQKMAYGNMKIVFYDYCYCKHQLYRSVMVGILNCLYQQKAYYKIQKVLKLRAKS